MQIDIEISEIFLVIMVLKTKGPLKKHKYEIFISLYLGISWIDFNLKLSKGWFMQLNQFWLIIVTQIIKVTMIIETSLCEIGVRSISGHGYNNFEHWPFDVFIKWNGTIFFVIYLFL
jgi:hypothetical protein